MSRVEKVIQPNLDWYKGLSARNGGPPRCPFASVHRCPRYYQSVSLLGKYGNTEIPSERDAQLLERWKKSDLWPVVNEQAVMIMGSGEAATIYSRFCPEVAYDTFGIFAEYLSRVGDDLDHDLRHQRLRGEGATSDDYRWNWAHASPLHYTDCPLYSPLLHNASGTGLPVDHQQASANSQRSLMRRVITSRPMKALAILGPGLAAAAKWVDNLRRIWDSLFHR